MKKLTLVFLLAVSLLCILVQAQNVLAKPNASVKFSTLRAENPNETKETLILPFAFPSESMGTTFGVGTMAKGYGQDQLLVAGAAWGSVDEAYGGVGGLWDYRLPLTNRFFFSVLGSIGQYPRQRAYTNVIRTTGETRAGHNDSDEDDFIEEEGNDNWFEAKIEFVLPIGSMKDSSMATYRLKDGLLTSGATGGDSWNPLESGSTVLVLRQNNRYQSYEIGSGTVDGTIHPLEFGLLYNNTDFAVNPSRGSSQYLSFTKDFAWGDSKEEWSFIGFEASKYFDLGETKHARQQVVALNFWTGNSPSWSETTLANGVTVISDDPPYLEGARLGGFYRMRAYPTNRFNDRSVIYTTAEYRFTPKWNPIAGVNWLRFLKLDWFQLVGFAEGGRVAPEYSFDELFSDWKFDAGLGLRAMVAGGVVRFDVAVSDEGSSAWVMFGQPF
jgi:hypothetical protein